VCLRIVVLISSMPTIRVSCLLGPLDRLSVEDALDPDLCIFIYILVGFPMRGSIGVRISPLCLKARRRPRTLFATHIGSSRVVSAGVIPGRERAAGGVSVGVSGGGVSSVMPRRGSRRRVVSVGSRGRRCGGGRRAEGVVTSGRCAVGGEGIHDGCSVRR
jgi:hypothetical protein